MTGTLAQLIALTSYGNAFLDDGVFPENFYPQNSVFQFCNEVKFVAFRKVFFSTKYKEVKAAPDPYKWFQQLKKDRCKKLCLRYESSADQSLAKDHKTAGFVGGGGTWLIEAVFGSHADHWANNWTVSDKDAPDRKIWSVKYGCTSWDQPITTLHIDVQEAKSNLTEALTKITAFAKKHTLDDWAGAFDHALKVLKSENPSDTFYHKDLIASKDYSPEAKQVLFGAGTAWVFGGMGSWNDLGFETNEDNKAYDDLSAALYNAINAAVIAAVNSFPGNNS